MKKYLVEFIGTFFLVLTVGLTAVFAPGAGALAPIAIGLSLAIMVYAGGPISGGHYNPAVTVGAWVRGACPSREVAPYIGVQLLGALLAALISAFLSGGETSVMTPPVLQSLVAEFLFTFALVYVILNVATSPSSEGNSYFGLAIGGTVVVGAYAVGGISGGAFNPAVAIGLLAMGKIGLGSLWIYLVACFLGGVAAALVYKCVNED